MSTIAKITSAILGVVFAGALIFLIWTWMMSNIFQNETTCEIPERTTIEGFRFNPISCRWEELKNNPAQEATETPTATPTPTESQPTNAPESQTNAHEAYHPTVVQPTQAANPPAPICTVIHDYQLKDLTEVATSSGNFLHVEYWVGGDNPEYETILPGGRYTLRISFAGGHVWEYRDCSFEQVKSQVDAHVARRLAQKANNGGYIEWQKTGFFNPVR